MLKKGVDLGKRVFSELFKKGVNWGTEMPKFTQKGRGFGRFKRECYKMYSLLNL